MPGWLGYDTIFSGSPRLRCVVWGRGTRVGSGAAMAVLLLKPGDAALGPTAVTRLWSTERSPRIHTLCPVTLQLCPPKDTEALSSCLESGLDLRLTLANRLWGKQECAVVWASRGPAHLCSLRPLLDPGAGLLEDERGERSAHLFQSRPSQASWHPADPQTWERTALGPRMDLRHVSGPS